MTTPDLQRMRRRERSDAFGVCAVLVCAVVLTTVVVLLAPWWSAALAAQLELPRTTVRTIVSVSYVVLVGLGSVLLVRRALRDAATSRRGWEELAAASAHGVLLFELGDPRRVVFVNHGVSAIAGRPRAAFLADPDLLRRVILAEERPRLESIFLEPNRGPWPQRFTVLRPGGERRAVELTGSLVGPDAKRPLFQALLMDVTEGEQRERALAGVANTERAAAQQLRDVVHLRDTFVSSISHELRTPLTVITGGADTLRRHAHELSLGVRSELERAIMEQSTRLSSLLDDVVNLGGAGAPSERHIPHQIVEVGHLVAEAVGASGIADRVELEMPGPVLARADEARLRRMVAELLGNADKYAPGSTIRLSLHNGGGSWVLRVHDQGPGLDLGDLGHVQEPFYRADADHPQPGLGLGLTFVAAVAAQHGGTMRLHNDGGLQVTVTASCDPAARGAGADKELDLADAAFSPT